MLLWDLAFSVCRNLGRQCRFSSFCFAIFHSCFLYSIVTGLPNPQPDHPVIMARFSWDCLQKMNEITKSLAETLGCVCLKSINSKRLRRVLDVCIFRYSFSSHSLKNCSFALALRSSDTTNLSVRVGLHSGPVTAGVLRGQKSRFQLFGDTVNTGTYPLCSSSFLWIPDVNP